MAALGLAHDQIQRKALRAPAGTVGIIHQYFARIIQAAQHNVVSRLGKGSRAHEYDDRPVRVQRIHNAVRAHAHHLGMNAVIGQHLLHRGKVQTIAAIAAVSGRPVEQGVGCLIVILRNVGDQHGGRRRAAAGGGNGFILAAHQAHRPSVIILIDLGNGHALLRNGQAIRIQMVVGMGFASAEQFKAGRLRRRRGGGLHRRFGALLWILSGQRLRRCLSGRNGLSLLGRRRLTFRRDGRRVFRSRRYGILRCGRRCLRCGGGCRCLRCGGGRRRLRCGGGRRRLRCGGGCRRFLIRSLGRRRRFGSRRCIRRFHLIRGLILRLVLGLILRRRLLRRRSFLLFRHGRFLRLLLHNHSKFTQSRQGKEQHRRQHQRQYPLSLAFHHQWSSAFPRLKKLF